LKKVTVAEIDSAASAVGGLKSPASAFSESKKLLCK